MANPKEVQSGTFADQFELKGDLGRGAFSVVKRCTLTRTGQDFAAKIINVKGLSQREKTKLEKEVRVCRMLRHESIVRLHYVFKESNINYLLFDLITGGELFDDIVAREYYSEKDASHCIGQILEAIKYCHGQGIIHRDLKPENLLLESKVPGSKVKLADFGLAVDCDKNHKEYFGFAGTPGYLAPEVVRKEPYGRPVDLWACGVILYILLVGYPPFWDDNQSRLFELIKSGKYEFPSPEWDTVTKTAKDLIKGLMTMDQDARVTAEAATANSWIKNREREASMVHRQDTLQGLKKFNAKRKLRAAVRAVQVVKFNSEFFQSDKSEAVTPSVPTGGPLGVGLGEGQRQLKGVELEILSLTEKLLGAINAKDFATYQSLCAPDLTCFEPEAHGHILKGMEFHKLYMENSQMTVVQQQLLNPHVVVMGVSTAYIAYTRFRVITNSSGAVTTECSNETRVWQYVDAAWKCVHFHRS